jgi:hypothetical protein
MREAFKTDRASGKKVGSDYFAMLATTNRHAPAGRYRIQAMSDDRARIVIDGKLVLDNWVARPSPSLTRPALLAASSTNERAELKIDQRHPAVSAAAGDQAAR